MRLEQYLTEGQDFEYIFDKIKKDCKPFIKQVKSGGLLYRGTKKDNPGIIKITPRKDRRPMSIHHKVQDILDDLFKKKFGWEARSSGVFAVGDFSVASQYSGYESGGVYSMWPIGSFKFLWSPNVADLFEEIWDTSQDWVEWFTSGHDELAKFVDTYTDKNLPKAIKSKHEIMISCKSYYMVLDGYDGEILNNL